MSVVTKGGDKGTTSLFSGESISKSSERVDAYGTLDELNSSLGFAKSLVTNVNIKKQIESIQRRLFTLGMELATHAEKHFKLKDKINNTDISEIESIIYEYEKELKLPPEFIIPGKTPASGAIDMARTIARRLERKMISLRNGEPFANTSAFIWVNRLSDYLFIAARVEER